ncbi:MAG: hypothetical protein ACT4PL_12180 [Phycisphaerales bacterium]
MTANSIVPILIGAGLTSGITLCWLVPALRMLRRRQGSSGEHRVHDRVLLAAVLAYPVAVWVCNWVIHDLVPWRWWVHLPDEARPWAVFGALPAGAFALLLRRVLGRWRPALVALAAGTIAPAGALVFEHGTHGWWYIRSEGLAQLLTVLHFAGLWHLIAGGGLLLWAARSRWSRTGICDQCGYVLSGLAPGSACPECGSRAGASTAPAGP